MVTPRGKAEVAAAAAAKDAEGAPLIDEATRIKGTPEQEAAYERALDTKYRADLLGVELPPVAPPGYVISERVEPSKPTFWTLLFRSERVPHRRTGRWAAESQQAIDGVARLSI